MNHQPQADRLGVVTLGMHLPSAVTGYWSFFVHAMLQVNKHIYISNIYIYIYIYIYMIYIYIYIKYIYIYIYIYIYLDIFVVFKSGNVYTLRGGGNILDIFVDAHPEMGMFMTVPPPFFVCVCVCGGGGHILFLKSPN